MQFILDPRTPAEARLLAAFINDYADLVELQTEQYRLESTAGVGQLAAETLKAAATQAETTSAKKGRTKKTEAAATATEPAGSTANPSSDPAAASTTTESTAESGNSTSSAATADTAAASVSTGTAEPAGNNDENFDDGQGLATQSDAVKVTHDDIKKLLGTLSQNGKRGEAVKTIRGYGDKGYNGVSEIAEADLFPIYAKLKAL